MTKSDYQQAARKLNEFTMLSKNVRYGLTTTPTSVQERLSNAVNYFKK